MDEAGPVSHDADQDATQILDGLTACRLLRKFDHPLIIKIQMLMLSFLTFYRVCEREEMQAMRTRSWNCCSRNPIKAIRSGWRGICAPGLPGRMRDHSKN